MGLLQKVVKGVWKTFRCSKCGYIWNSRSPHSRLNPPSKCPKCGERL